MAQFRAVFLSFTSVFIFILSLSITSSISAQTGATSGTIVGVIHDRTNAVISGAKIVARQIDTNLTQETVSQENGSYLFIQLSPGKYELSAQADGFMMSKESLVLTLGNTALLDFSLDVAATDPNVVLVTANQNLEPKTESSTNIEQNRIVDLPSQQRNFLELSVTAPRVTTDRLPNNGVVATSGISANSQSGRFNNITIDGLDNNDHLTGAARSVFGQDGIQEFQVITDGYSAEFGRVLGAIVNIVTRGGTNQLHGESFFINRNDRFSARDVFSRTTPPLDQYQFGALLSGPVKKDKAFLFTSFERLTAKKSNIVNLTDEALGATRSQNIFLKNGPVPFSVGTTALLARFDTQLSPNSSLWVRYNGGFTYDGSFQQFRGLTAETSGGIEKLSDNTIAASNTYISTKLNLVNEARILFGRRKQDILPIQATGPQTQLDTMEGSVLFGRNAFLPQNREENTYQFVDNVSLPRGRHQIKFGIDLFYSSLSKFSVPTLKAGLAVFTTLDVRMLFDDAVIPFGVPLVPFQAFAPSLRTPNQIRFLNQLSKVLTQRFPGFPLIPLAKLPIPASFTQSFGNPDGASAYKFFSGYLQDDFKIRPNLVVKAGLRYDLNIVKFAPHPKLSFSPRLAIAYQPAKLPNLNIRAAYGIFVGAPLAGVVLNAKIFQNFTNITIPFPFSVLLYNQPGNSFPESNVVPNIPNKLATINQLSQTFRINNNLRNSYAQEATLAIDYKVDSVTKIALSYNYVRGIKLFGSRNINPVVTQFKDPVETIMKGRVFPDQGNIFDLESAFDSYYHAFTASIDRRFSNRFNLLVHYTYSKAIDNSVDFFPIFQEIAYPLQPGLERSLSIQDVRNRFVASGVWDLTYSKNVWLRNFRLSTIINLDSGKPYNLLTGVDLDRSGDFPPADRPLGIGRNAGITPGFAGVDIRLGRNFSPKESYKIQAYVEAFNIFNRVNIDPNQINRLFLPDPTTRMFNLPPTENGRFILPKSNYRGDFSPRQFQVGLRLSF